MNKDNQFLSKLASKVLLENTDNNVNILEHVKYAFMGAMYDFFQDALTNEYLQNQEIIGQFHTGNTDIIFNLCSNQIHHMLNDYYAETDVDDAFANKINSDYIKTKTFIDKILSDFISGATKKRYEATVSDNLLGDEEDENILTDEYKDYLTGKFVYKSFEFSEHIIKEHMQNLLGVVREYFMYKFRDELYNQP